MLDLDYTAIYTWAKSRTEPFTPYKFEQTFNLGRNSSVPYLETPAFERVPLITSKRYYTLSTQVDSEDSFRTLIKQRPVARITKPLGLVTTAFGNKDLSANTIITNYQKTYFDISDHQQLLNETAFVARQIAIGDLSELTDESLGKYVEVLASAYPVLVKASALLHLVFSDPRLADPSTIRDALKGKG